MQIHTLALDNFRRFAHFEMEFEPDLTLINARNGKGKTTVLEAATIALQPFVGTLMPGQSASIKQPDARYLPTNGFEREQDFPVAVTATFANPNAQSRRELRKPNGRTTSVSTHELTEYANDLLDKIRADRTAVELPVVAYYSSKRLFALRSGLASRIAGLSRTVGYQDCLSALSNFKQLEQWMATATLAQLQEEQRQTGAAGIAALRKRVQGIENAVDSVLADEGWTGFHYSLHFEELAISHPDHGLMPISALSDGTRAMVSLVADLAKRASQLNPDYGENAARLASGIVLIDEVDLHLHPEWQQRVVPSLQATFPNMQFIISTHSPRVLSSVPRKHIRVLEQDEDQQWHTLYTPPKDDVHCTHTVFREEVGDYDDTDKGQATQPPHNSPTRPAP